MQRNPPKKMLLASERSVKVAEMVRDGYTFPEIAKALGYKDRSGPRRALKRYYAELDRTGLDDVKAHRKTIAARLDKAHRDLVALLEEATEEKDRKAIIEALGKLTRNALASAQVLGVVKLAPEVKVEAPQAIGYDLSKLTPEEAWTLRELQKKLGASSPEESKP